MKRKIATPAAVLVQFRVVVRAMRSHYLRVQRQAGISGAQLRALAMIAGPRPLRISELAESLGTTQPTASNLVESLSVNGFVLRRQDARDKRVTRLYTTAAGRARLRRAPGPHDGVLQEALQKLESDELGQLSRGLEALLARMGGQREGSREPMSNLILPASARSRPTSRAP